MYDYLANLSTGESCAVVYTEGRICVWTSTAEGKDLLLRHCAFLVEYMSVPAIRIAVVYSDIGVGKTLRKCIRKSASISPLKLCHIIEVGDPEDYDYVLVADAHNMEPYSNTLLTRICCSSTNVGIWVDGKSAWKHPNLGLAAFFQDNQLDFEITTGNAYTVAGYLDLLHDGLVDLNHKREAERERQEQLAREQAERERQEQLAREQAERERQEQLAREQAERERQEQLAREQAERERQEQLAREQAERERQEQLAREQAERERQEQLAREQAERESQEQLAREQAERERQEQLAREQAERERQEQLAREQAERERQEQLAREQAERERQEQLAHEQAERERQKLHDMDVGEWSRGMMRNYPYDDSPLEHRSLRTKDSSETEKSISQYGLKPLVVDEQKATTKHEPFNILPLHKSLSHADNGIDPILKADLDSYLKGLSNGCAYAIVQDQGCVYAIVMSDDIRSKLALRYYAFLLGFLHVRVEDVAFVCVNQHLVYGTKQYFTMSYRRLTPKIMSLSEMDDSKSFRYLIVADLHNLNLASLVKMKSLSDKCTNVYLCCIPAFMSVKQKTLVDGYVQSLNSVMEIRTNSQYPLDDYIRQNMNRWLQIRKETFWTELGAAVTKGQAYYMDGKNTKKKSKSKVKSIPEIEENLPKRVASSSLKPKAKSENRQAVEILLKLDAESHVFRLNPYFAHYKKDWADIQERSECYWDTIGDFATSFDPSSDDLVDKMNDAVANGKGFFPKDFLGAMGKLKQCQEICPDEILHLLRNLFDETVNLNMRFKRYHNQLEQMRKNQISKRVIIPKTLVGHLNTLEAAVNMLALAYPHKYYFFNLDCFERFCKKAMFRVPSMWYLEDNYRDFVGICDRVRAALITYSDISKLKIGRHKSYDFDARLLTYDFICTVADIYS